MKKIITTILAAAFLISPLTIKAGQVFWLDDGKTEWEIEIPDDQYGYILYGKGMEIIYPMIYFPRYNYDKKCLEFLTPEDNEEKNCIYLKEVCLYGDFFDFTLEPFKRNISN